MTEAGRKPIVAVIPRLLHAIARKPIGLLLALVAGFYLGTINGYLPAGVDALLRIVGKLWLDALRATIVPLVFAMVTTGIAKLGRDSRDLAQIGGRLPLTCIALLGLAAVLAAILAPWCLHMFPAIDGGTLPVPASSASMAVAPTSMGAVIGAMIPSNVVAAAAAGSIVPLALFGIVFGLAIGRTGRDESAALLFGVLSGIADAMIAIVGWVMRVAPLGIFALSFGIGATTGVGIIYTLARYIAAQALVSTTLGAIAYLLAVTVGRMSFATFAGAAIQAQAVAASTQSSIASLPAMLTGARRLGISDRDASVLLPLEVALFKVTAPASAMIVGLVLCDLHGMAVPWERVVTAIPLAILASITVLGVPGSVSFLAANAPVALALGAPVELLPLLMAADTIPDMFRTTANVTTQIAVATLLPRSGDDGDEVGR